MLARLFQRGSRIISICMDQRSQLIQPVPVHWWLCILPARACGLERQRLLWPEAFSSNVHQSFIAPLTWQVCFRRVDDARRLMTRQMDLLPVKLWVW